MTPRSFRDLLVEPKSPLFTTAELADYTALERRFPE